MNKPTARTIPQIIQHYRLSTPKRLQLDNNFVLYKPVVEEGRVKKLPINPRTGRLASTVDPETWTSFEVALKAIAKFKIIGLGYVITKESGLVFIDLDHCLEGSKASADALYSIKSLNTYCEVSPSSSGLHFILEATCPFDGRKNPKLGIEVYSDKRFMTISGRRIKGSHHEPMKRQAELDQFLKKYLPTPQNQSTVVAKPNRQLVLSMAQILAKAMKDKKFAALYDGCWESLGYPSQSEADFALLEKLRWWTTNNPNQIEHLFRQSRLYRPDKGEAYLQRSIGKLVNTAGMADNTSQKAQESSKMELKRGDRPKRQVVIALRQKEGRL